MCDSETIAYGDQSATTSDLELTASSLDIMDTSDVAATLLHQTTQSLLMASNLMLMPNGGGAGPIASSDGKAPSVVGGMAQVVAPPQMAMAMNNHVKINVDDLIRENYALREKLKEVSADRDRLLCEVSNLRLELDMSELKRLPQERYVSGLVSV